MVYNNKYQDGVQWHDVPCFSRSAQYQTSYNVFDDGVQFLILEEVPKSLYMDTAFCKWSFLNELSALKNVCQQRSQLTGSIKEKVVVGAYQTLRTCLLQNTVLYLHSMCAGAASSARTPSCRWRGSGRRTGWMCPSHSLTCEQEMQNYSVHLISNIYYIFIGLLI